MEKKNDVGSNISTGVNLGSEIAKINESCVRSMKSYNNDYNNTQYFLKVGINNDNDKIKRFIEDHEEIFTDVDFIKSFAINFDKYFQKRIKELNKD